MLSFCLKCSKNTERKKPRFVTTKSRRIMLSSNCAVFGSKKIEIFQKQESKMLLIVISKIPVLSPLLI